MCIQFPHKNPFTFHIPNRDILQCNPPVALGYPQSATAYPPTTKYSILFEFSNCNSSLKSCGSRIITEYNSSQCFQGLDSFEVCFSFPKTIVRSIVDRADFKRLFIHIYIIPFTSQVRTFCNIIFRCGLALIITLYGMKSNTKSGHLIFPVFVCFVYFVGKNI